jgi:hypothetical protein
MTLNQVYAEVARRADTDKTKINAAEVSRALACFFTVVNELEPCCAMGILERGFRVAEQKKAKAKK